MTKSQAVFQESRSGALGEATDGSYPVVLLTPGQGATAFYSEEVIARDAAGAFPKGTHVYLNHLQEGESRSPEKILGTLVEDTVIRESDGAAVNRFKPVSRWAPLVEDVHKIAGLSINAAGKARLGMIDGRSTRIAEAIEYHITNSVDLVSYPGRPGSGFTESYDSLYKQAMEDVHPESSADGAMKEGIGMETDAKVDALAAEVAKLVVLVESLKPKAPEVTDADTARKGAVDAFRAVESAEVSASVKTKLIEGIENGSLDAEGVKAKVAEHVALREELKTEFETKFNESHGAIGATGASGAAAPVTIKGWGS